MATGRSICKKCGKDFKWYRNVAQGPAKYCSKKCKDEDHASWCSRTDKNQFFICEDCGKEFKRYTSEKRDIPRFCSKECMNRNVHTWNSIGRYRVDEATEEEKLDRLKESYERHVVRGEGCWEWSGVLHKSGYAVLKYGKKQIGAHQASWLIHKGKIENGLWTLHHCDNKKCTNPDHIYLGNAKRNAQDREDRQRRPIRRGDSHPNSKLNEDQVKEIKKRMKIGITLTRLSKDFSISLGSLEAIKSGTTWKHVRIEEE